QIQILGVSVRIVMRADVTYHNVKKSIRTELEAAAAVIFGNTLDFEQTSARLAGIGGNIGIEFAFDDDGRDRSVFEDLVFNVIFSIVAKLRMKGQIEQTVGAALVKYFAG